MKQYRFAFYVSEKERTTEFGTMLAAGAKVHGDTVELVPQFGFTESLIQKKLLADFDGACNLGLARAAKTIKEAYLGAGKHFMFFDKGYTQRKAWRVSVDAWQPLAYFQRFMRPEDRRMIAGPRQIKKRPKRDDDRVILFAGACQNYSNFCNLGNVNDYNEGVLKNLRGNTKRKILYRPNPSWYKKHRDEFRPVHEGFENVELSEPDATSFQQELERSHLVVTHGSSATVAALQEGIPVMVLGGGVCKPLALHDGEWDRIEDPHVPKLSVVEQFFNDLSYCQWSTQEYADGTAWAELRLVLSYLAKIKEDTPTTEVLRQYQLMHKHPGYFRGLTTLKYATEIGTLIHQTKSDTVLDYGSGKGEQYADPYNCHLYWDAQVACYDPAVPGIDELPDMRFDGVICCDVMEHVPEAHVQETLRQVIRYADKFVYFAIATTPAKKELPDGRNCHLTVRSQDWWAKQIAEASAALLTPPLQIELRTPKEDSNDD